MEQDGDCATSCDELGPSLESAGIESDSAIDSQGLLHVVYEDRSHVFHTVWRWCISLNIMYDEC